MSLRCTCMGTPSDQKGCSGEGTGDVGGGTPATNGRDRTWKLGLTLDFLPVFLKHLDDDGCFKDNPDFTTNDLVEQFIKPAVKERQCRYVDLIDQKYIHQPNVFVSHAWKCGFRFLVDRLFKQFNAEVRYFGSVSVWIDAFAVNQNQNEETAQDINDFERVIRETEITAFNLDMQGASLTRVSCLFEVWQTFKHRGVGSLSMMLFGIRDGLPAILDSIDVAKAEAFMKSDRDWILGEIEKEYGGDFTEFNADIRRAVIVSISSMFQSSILGTNGTMAYSDGQEEAKRIFRDICQGKYNIPELNALMSFADGSGDDKLDKLLKDANDAHKEKLKRRQGRA
eukprot:843790-Prorocentrum_minimum.AAC.2